MRDTKEYDNIENISWSDDVDKKNLAYDCRTTSGSNECTWNIP